MLRLWRLYNWIGFDTSPPCVFIPAPSQRLTLDVWLEKVSLAFIYLSPFVLFFYSCLSFLSLYFSWDPSLFYCNIAGILTPQCGSHCAKALCAVDRLSTRETEMIFGIHLILGEDTATITVPYSPYHLCNPQQSEHLPATPTVLESCVSLIWRRYGGKLLPLSPFLFNGD